MSSCSICPLSKSYVWLALAPLAFAQSGESKAANVDADCSAINSSFTPVIGQVYKPVPAAGTRPAKGVAKADPNYGACVVRATDHAAQGLANFVRNDYSRRQAFNADNTRFIAYADGGAWYLYDANTLVALRELNGPGGDAEPQWHPTDPKSLYYVPTNGGTTLLKLDVESNQTTTAANFASKLPWSGVAHIWTRSEGSASADGRYWCFIAYDASFATRGVFTYDLQTQTVLGSRSLSVAPDHVSMSASGRSCVVSGDPGPGGGTVSWDRTFTTSRQIHPTSEHSDIALGPNGDDYFVFADFQSNAGDIVMVNLDTGVRTTLMPTYINGGWTSYHVSGKAFSKPGWVLISTYSGQGTKNWQQEKIMAVELKANPTIISLANHQSIYNDNYWAEPHATVSRDFTRVLFSSNWGASSAPDVDAYILRLPKNLLDVQAPIKSQPLPAELLTSITRLGSVTIFSTTQRPAARVPKENPPRSTRALLRQLRSWWRLLDARWRQSGQQ